MNEWIADLREQVAEGNPCVLLTVAGIRGSAPRELGAKMLVTRHESIGTIGGGRLEFESVQIAFDALRNLEDGCRLRKFTLGADCGQCCGGVVEILFESFCATGPAWLHAMRKAFQRREPVVIATTLNRPAAVGRYLITASGECIFPENAVVDAGLHRAAAAILSRPGGAQRTRLTMHDGDKQDVLLEPIVGSGLNVAIFGAGHVGSAAMNILSSLDCNTRWIDSRRNIFPGHMPANVQKIESEQPSLEVAAMPAGCCYLVMTHSHPLDLEIVERVLARDDFSYCGLIGSVSKRRSFEKRLLKLGTTQDRIDRLTCPIGIDGIDGKNPAEIAVAVAAEILKIHHAKTAGSADSGEVAGNVRFLHR